MQVEVTKKQLAAMWEEGGGMTNTGSALLVAGTHGEPLSPLYIRRRGHLACGKHALFHIKSGYFIIRAEHHRRSYTIQIWKIADIRREPCGVIHEAGKPCLECEDRGWNYALDLTPVAKFTNGEWDTSVPPELLEVIQAAREKAECWHCREPHYVRAQ